MVGTLWNITISVCPDDDNQKIAVSSQTFHSARIAESVTTADRDALQRIMLDAADQIAPLALMGLTVSHPPVSDPSIG